MKKRILLSLVVLVVSTVFLAKNVEAAAGINRRINFQGKVVKTDGTNVADNNYNFQFSLWTTPTVGTSLWTEVWNTGNSQIGVSSGIFSVDLGTNTTFPTSIDFNADTLYLSIGFSGEADMSPRIRMTAVPYAFNAEKVGGLTVTNTTGTLTIPNGKTISFADGFTTVGAGITLDQSLATTNSVSFAGLSIGGTVAFTNLPVGTGTTILYIGAGGSLSAGTLPTGTVYTATNGLNLNANAFGLGGTLTQNTQIGTSSFFLSFIGLGSSVGLSVGPSGYVGIGKSNPGAIFDIDDNASIGTGLRVTGGGSGYNLATFSRDIGGTGKISIHSSGSNPQISFQSAVNTFSIGVSGDNFKISNNAALGTNDYFVLNNSGYVGIGNANPDSLLSIASNLSGGFGAGTQSFSVKNTSGINSATTIGLYPDSGSDFDISIWGSGATPANKAVLIQRNNAPFGIYTNNIERLSINGSGSIGLGTTNPGYKLHVIGDVGVSTALTVGTSASIGSNLTVGGTVSFSGLPVGTGTSIIYLGASGNLLSGTLPAGSVYTATNGLNLNGSAFGLGGTLTQNTRLNIGNTEVLYFQLASGYVGIGTTNPKAKLDINGNVSILGELNLNNFYITNGTQPGNSNFVGYQAGLGATSATNSNFFGNQAGNNAFGAHDSNFLGYYAGLGATSAYNSNFLGIQAGMGAANASNSNFLGYYAGLGATNALNSNFFGVSAGSGAINASNSNFFGSQAGLSAVNAPYSNFIGYQAGTGATNAANSVFLGTFAGYMDTVNNGTTGASIAIGRYAGTGGFGNSIAIGRGVINTGTTQVNIGNVLYINGIYNSDTQSGAAVTGANVGIGTTNPLAKLDIAGASPIIRLTDTQDKTWTVGEVMAGLEFYSSDNSGNLPAVATAIKSIIEGSAYGNSQGLAFYVNNDETNPSERMRLAHNGYLGLGTTLPGTVLDVVGGSGLRLRDVITDSANKVGLIVGGHYTNSEENVTLMSIDSTSDNNILRFGGDTSAIRNAASIVTFFTAANNTTLGGTERMRIDPSGKVGIGTTNPTSLLDVSGATTSTPGPYLTASRYFVNQSGTSPDTFYDQFNYVFTPGTTTTYTGGIYAQSNYAYHGGTGTLTNLFGQKNLAENANTGRIINLIASHNTVANDTSASVWNAYGALYSANNYGVVNNRLAGVYIDTPINTGTINQDIGLYIADQNKGTTNYSIYSEGGNAYFGGNMGIGTTNPTAKLEISGDAAGLTFSGGTSDHVITAVGATLVIGGHKVTGTLDMGNQTIDRVNTLSGYPNQDFLIRSLGTGNLNINANDGQTGKFQWWGGTGTPQVVFTNAGNVGIGTTSPTAKLEITAAGTTNLYGVKSTVSLADGDLYTQNQYAGYFHAANVGTMDSSYGIYAISDATDYNNGSIGVYGEGQTIGLYGYSNGGFGVYGFSSSTGMYANGTNTGLQAIANSATGYGIFTWNQNASGYAIYSSQGKNYFAGNVGIGITTPSQKLDVNGSVNIGGSIAIGTIPSVSDNNRILTSSGAGLGILQYINTSAWDKNSANDIAVATNGLRLIGTTAFGLGGTLSQPGFTTINSGTGSSGMAFVVDRLVISATASNYNPDINYNRIKPQAAGTILELTQEDYQEGNNALIYTSNIQNVSSLTFDAGYGPLLFLDGDNGRVGIGTTSPISKFHVVGSSRFEGSTINKGFNAMGDQGTMIPNGGFEINDDAATTIADGWIEDVENSSGTYSFGVGNTAKQGEHSQEIYATTTSQGAVISECIPVTSENTYNLNAVVKGSAATTSTLGLAIKHYANGDCSGASTTLAAVSSGSITTSYTQYGGTVLIPSGQFSARVLVRNNTPSANVTMFVDSVTFSHGASYTIDLAENYYSNTDLLPGQIVGTQDNLISGVTPSTKDNESSLIGVVSTNPAITLGNTLTREGTYLKKIALSGRVPVIVSTKNGTIASGDRITSSSFAPGVGGKAVKSGMTVGTALQSTNSWSTSSCQSIGSISNIVWPDDDGSDTQSRSCYVLPDGTFIGKIMMFVNLSWYDPGLNLTATGEINVNYNISNEVLASLGYPGSKNEIETATYSLTDSVGNAVTKIAQFGKIAVAKINTGFLSANGAVIDNLAAKKIASETIITNDITATNIDTTELIAQNIGASEATFSVVHADLIISPEGNITDVISTKINSLREEFKNMMVGQTLGGGPPLTQISFGGIPFDYQTKLDGIKYAVAELQTERITPLIDSDGNPVEIKIDGNVRINGVLTVDSIISNSIEGLDVSNQIAGLNEKYDQLKSDVLGINSSLSEISVATTGVVSPTPTPEPTNFLTKVLAEFWNKVLFKGQTEFEKNPLFSKDTAGLAILNMGETGVEVKFDNSFETTPIVNISLMADSDEEGQSLSENYVYYVANRNQNGFVIRLNKVARNNIKFSWTALLIKDVKTSQNQVLPTGVVEQTNPVETVTPTITVVPTLEPTAMPTLEPTAMPTLEPTVIPTLEPTPTGVVVQ